MSTALDHSLPRRIWKAIRHDIGRKLTALVMASGLWLVLQNLVSARQPLELQVRAVGTQAEADQERLSTPGVYLIVPDELIVLSMSDPRVHLTVSGLRDEVVGLNLSAKLVFTVADLGGQDEVTLSRPLERDSFSVPWGQVFPKLTSFKVRPEVLQVTLARRDTAEITLTADNVVLVGKPKDHYFFKTSSIKLYPNTVDLIGPRTVIESLRQDSNKIKLEPVDLANRSSTVSGPVGLSQGLRDLGVTMQTGRGEQQVIVTVPLEAEDIEKALFAVPIVYLNEQALELRPQKASNFPKSMDIKLVGPPAELDGRSDEDLLKNFVLIFDWQKQAPPTFTGTATGHVSFSRINLPDSVSATDARGKRDLTIEYELETLAAPTGTTPGATDGK